MFGQDLAVDIAYVEKFMDKQEALRITSRDQDAMQVQKIAGIARAALIAADGATAKIGVMACGHPAACMVSAFGSPPHCGYCKTIGQIDQEIAKRGQESRILLEKNDQLRGVQQILEAQIAKMRSDLEPLIQAIYKARMYRAAAEIRAYLDKPRPDESKRTESFRESTRKEFARKYKHWVRRRKVVMRKAYRNKVKEMYEKLTAELRQADADHLVEMAEVKQAAEVQVSEVRDECRRRIEIMEGELQAVKRKMVALQRQYR